jgi:hypothetical protein
VSDRNARAHGFAHIHWRAIGPKHRNR